MRRWRTGFGLRDLLNMAAPLPSTSCVVFAQSGGGCVRGGRGWGYVNIIRNVKESKAELVSFHFHFFFGTSFLINAQVSFLIL